MNKGWIDRIRILFIIYSSPSPSPSPSPWMGKNWSPFIPIHPHSPFICYVLGRAVRSLLPKIQFGQVCPIHLLGTCLISSLTGLQSLEWGFSPSPIPCHWPSESWMPVKVGKGHYRPQSWEIDKLNALGSVRPSVCVFVCLSVCLLGIFHLKGYGGGWQENLFCM